MKGILVPVVAFVNLLVCVLQVESIKWQSGAIAAETSSSRFERSSRKTKAKRHDDSSESDGGDINYRLYTRKNKIGEGEKMKLSDGPDGLSHWHDDEPVKILIHSWLEKASNDIQSAQTIKNAYVEDGRKANIILVDWDSEAKNLDYQIARKSIPRVGKQVGLFINGLVDKHFVKDYSDIHVIGYGLGAQIAGVAGHIIHKDGKKVGRITGLDPFWEGFEKDVDKSKRLSADDADFVDVIHCNMGTKKGKFGANFAMGTVDFFPNGGVTQPGCDPLGFGEAIGLCSTAKCFKYYAKSIEGFKMKGCSCGSYQEYQSGDCDDNCNVLMGDPTPHTAEGNLYLRTKEIKD